MSPRPVVSPSLLVLLAVAACGGESSPPEPEAAAAELSGRDRLLGTYFDY